MINNIYYICIIVVPGFRSLCMIPLACSQSMARAISRAKFIATWRSNGLGRILVKYFRRDIPGKSSVTITIRGSLHAPINCERIIIRKSKSALWDGYLQSEKIDNQMLAQRRINYDILHIDKCPKDNCSNYIYYLYKIVMVDTRHHINFPRKTIFKRSSFFWGAPTLQNFYSNNSIYISGKSLSQ